MSKYSEPFLHSYKNKPKRSPLSDLAWKYNSAKGNLKWVSGYCLNLKRVGILNDVEFNTIEYNLITALRNLTHKYNRDKIELKEKLNQK